MSPFEVWAPAAASVEIEIDGARHALTRGERGMWAGDVDGADHGTDYGVVVDGGAARPDPRSPWQPHGVHAASRLVDHTRFSWTDRGWSAPPLSSWIVYEAHVGTFTPAGTFEAAAEKLDHLVDLGVTALEIMPVAEFPGTRGWGYDGVDLYAPHHAYGGPEGLKRLVDACHARGLACVLDVVYNHLGPAGNYLREFGPYFTDRYATPWGDAINLDGPGCDAVREFFIENALTWLRDYHFDALRLDAVHAILDTSATHFLEQLAARVDVLEAELGRSLYLIAESDLNDPRVVRDPAAGGYGIDAQWSDDFHHSLHSVLTGERDGYYADFGTIEDLARSLREAFVYAGRFSAYRDRVHGRRPEGLGGERFLGYMQNHDQIGNRARGERMSALVEDPGLLKIGAALVLTSPFVPMLFQGEEWGAATPFLYFTDHEDAQLGAAISEGRRREFAAFGWAPDEVPDPQDAGTHRASVLDWDELDDPRNADMLQWHRDLIRLRARTPSLRAGPREDVVTRFDEDRRWLVVERAEITVACNFSDAPTRIPLDAERVHQTLLASGKAPGIDAREIELEPYSVALFSASP